MALFTCFALFFLLSGAVVISSGARSSSASAASGAQSAYARKLQRSRQIGTQAQILERMFSAASAYDAENRPPVRDFADHSAIVVITSVYINRITWSRNTAEVDLYLRQQWEDSRLSYEVDPREGINEVVLPRNRRIWRPDSFFIGTEEDAATASERQRSRVVIEPSGYVRASEKRILTVSTEDVGSFPLSNRKSFTLKLSSFNYPIDDVVYLWANSPPRVLPVEVSEELLDDNTEYSFEDASAGDCIGNYSVGAYSCISVSVTFVGQSAGGMFRIFLPCILLVIASWLHFWIHGSWSVPRTFSAAVPFFIFIAILFLLPHPSKAISVWLLFCTLITFFSLVEYFLVICCGMHRRVQFSSGVLQPNNNTATTIQTTKTVPVGYTNNNNNNNPQLYDPHHNQFDGDEHRYPPYQHQQQQEDVAQRVSHGNEPLAEVTTTTTTVGTTEPQFHSQKALTTTSNVQVNNRIDLVSRILFPVVFLVFLIVFFIFFSL